MNSGKCEMIMKPSGSSVKCEMNMEQLEQTLLAHSLTLTRGWNVVCWSPISPTDVGWNLWLTWQVPAHIIWDSLTLRLACVDSDVTPAKFIYTSREPVKKTTSVCRQPCYASMKQTHPKYCVFQPQKSSYTQELWWTCMQTTFIHF